MRKRMWVVLVLAGAFVLAPGCGGDDTPAVVDEALLDLADCSGLGMMNAEGVSEGILKIILVLANPAGGLPPGVTWDPVTREYAVDVDLDDDGLPESHIEGRFSTSSDVSDGLDPGEAGTALWDITINPGITGTGAFIINRLSADVINVSGGGAIQSSAACRFEITGMQLRVDPADPEDVGNPGDYVEFSILRGGDTLAGRMDFDGTSVVDVTATYKGATITYKLDLDTYVPSF